MESFIFNDFKRRIVEGEVPLEDTWTLFPVNKSFTAEFDDKLEYVKTDNDLVCFIGQIIKTNLITLTILKQKCFWKIMFTRSLKLPI